MGQTFTHHRFVVPINEAESISMFWFTIDEGDGTKPTVHDNGGGGYPVQQDSILYVPAHGRVTLEGTEPVHRRFQLTAAVRYSVQDLARMSGLTSSPFFAGQNLPLSIPRVHVRLRQLNAKLRAAIAS